MNTCYFEYVLYIMKLLVVVVVVDPKQDTTHPPRKKKFFFSFFLFLTNSYQSNPIRLIDYHIHSFLSTSIHSKLKGYIYYLVKWKTNLVHPYPHPSNIPIYYYYRIISVVKCYLFLFLPRFSYCSISHYFPPQLSLDI